MSSLIFTVGTVHLSRSVLEAQKCKRRRLDLNIIGVLTIADDVTPSLIEEAVGPASVRGSVRGPDAAVKALKARMR